jgi:hypothetical protein
MRVLFTKLCHIESHGCNYASEAYSSGQENASPTILNLGEAPWSRDVDGLDMKYESRVDFGSVVKALMVILMCGPLVLASGAMCVLLLWLLFTAWPAVMTGITLGVLTLIWIARGGLQRWRESRVRRQWERYWESPEGQQLLEERRASEIAEAKAAEVAKAERENRPRPSLRVLHELTADEWRPPPIVLSAELERLLEPCLDAIRLTNTASIPFFMAHLRASRTDAEMLADVLTDRGILGPRDGSDLPQEILVDLNLVT